MRTGVVRNIGVALCFFLVPAMGSIGLGAIEPTLDQLSRVDTEIISLPTGERIGLSYSPADIRRILGQPLSEGPNEQPGNLRFMEYTGLRILYIDGFSSLSSLQILGADYLTSRGLTVGAGIEEINEAYGEGPKRDNIIYYRYTRPSTDPYVGDVQVFLAFVLNSDDETERILLNFNLQ